MNLEIIKDVILGSNAVDARTLWENLESKQRFGDWVKTKVLTSLFFEENYDFTVFHGITKNPISELGGRPRVDYLLTVDCAKKISMAEQTEKGEEARKYFIECERIARGSLQPQVPTNYLEAVKALAVEIEAKEQALLLLDVAVATKAEINNKKTATAMNTASQKSKENKKLVKALQRHDCKTMTELLEEVDISSRAANTKLEKLGYLFTESVDGKNRKRLTKKGETIAKEFPGKKFVQIGILPSCEEQVLDIVNV